VTCKCNVNELSVFKKLLGHKMRFTGASNDGFGAEKLGKVTDFNA